MLEAVGLNSALLGPNHPILANQLESSRLRPSTCIGPDPREPPFHGDLALFQPEGGFLVALPLRPSEPHCGSG